MSNGAENFYTSEKVTVQKVIFKNQYQMTVVGNLFVPNNLDRNARQSAIIDHSASHPVHRWRTGDLQGFYGHRLPVGRPTQRALRRARCRVMSTCMTKSN